MNVEFYTGVDERLDVPVILPPVPDLRRPRRRRSSSPTTSPTPARRCEPCSEFCEGKVGRGAHGGALREVASVVKCDYVWRRTDRWINFPWSGKDPVVKRGRQVLDA